MVGILANRSSPFLSHPDNRTNFSELNNSAPSILQVSLWVVHHKKHIQVSLQIYIYIYKFHEGTSMYLLYRIQIFVWIL